MTEARPARENSPGCVTPVLWICGPPGELCIMTGGRSVAEVADQIATTAGWPAAP